jgi:hypothetical protein
VRLPSPDAVLPLPAGLTVLHQDARCGPSEQFGPRSGERQFTVAATGGLDGRELHLRLGAHPRRAKGWPATCCDPFTVHFGCRRSGWLNPYAVRVDLHRDEPAVTIVRLTFYNARDGVVYGADVPNRLANSRCRAAAAAVSAGVITLPGIAPSRSTWSASRRWWAAAKSRQARQVTFAGWGDVIASGTR